MNYKLQYLFLSLLIPIALLLGGCVRPAPEAPTPAVSLPNGSLPETAPTDQIITVPTAEPTNADEDAATTDNDPTDVPEISPTVTLFISAPTEPNGATETPAILATSTLPPIPSKTPTQAPLSQTGQFDPHKTYGQPQFDKTSFLHLNNWMANNGDLPNDGNIQLALDADGNLSVTGKNALYYTWWFSAPYIEDGYVEMEVRTANTCEGRAGYGMILNGPQKGSTTNGSHGYVVLLSCDGFVFMDRLDATKDDNGLAIYASTNLFWWTEDENIQRGANKTNTLGVLIEEGTITIFVNGFEFYTVYDDTYSGGRLGMFVYPDETAGFTYTVTDLTIWELTK